MSTGLGTLSPQSSGKAGHLLCPSAEPCPARAAIHPENKGKAAAIVPVLKVFYERRISLKCNSFFLVKEASRDSSITSFIIASDPTAGLQPDVLGTSHFPREIFPAPCSELTGRWL